MTYLYIFIGGGLGSLCRFLVGKAALSMMKIDFPLGTFIANIIACVLLALIVVGTSGSSENSAWIQPLIIVGFCGGFSTFSTFSNDTFNLLEAGNVVLAVANIMVSIIVGVGLIYFIRTKV
ncbi:MAG: fluoride efflux transporter CrcB [Crocinitomicaceae bacterium]|nr:fluoride efflux transporter CrcB [Crocinitomicaceae bacterium]